MVHDPIAGVDRDEDFHVPLKMVMIAGRDDDENLKALLSTSVRLKGEQVWLRLSDVIRIEGGEYSIYRCSRCGADLKSGEGKCANCGAQYGRRK
jgi:DNA-directed RNA polymerase subunit RPC12/RpoP